MQGGDNGASASFTLKGNLVGESALIYTYPDEGALKQAWSKPGGGYVQRWLDERDRAIVEVTGLGAKTELVQQVAAAVADLGKVSNPPTRVFSSN